jgi:hypothetical protein
MKAFTPYDAVKKRGISLALLQAASISVVDQIRMRDFPSGISIKNCSITFLLQWPPIGDLHRRCISGALTY